ncbi:diguanylate cyclase domain-containing protein [Butyrivibrio fibrisolvens]|uniref:sensor domain-containing diguanylate cyclase n=1 Tax=Butyrivibrio fibrisolvens TaxID=831 RepID=UPI00042743AE|nr:diguanylate cyclase [Butyrivibrio fibrisolvens]
MKQYRYILNKKISLDQMINEIRELPEYKNGYKALLQVVEQDCDPVPIQRDLDVLKKGLPNVTIVGMTSHGALSKTTHSIRYTVCSILFFEKSDFEVTVYDCHDQTPKEAGKDYKGVLRGYKSPKAVLMMSSDFSLCPEPFIDCINELEFEIIVFGALAGTKRMGDDKSLIYVDDKIYDRAILAVAFCGDELHFAYDYNLGFKSLGKELVVTKSDDVGVVYEIDNKPAFDIYSQHLGVEMNDYFFENTSSFPFMLRENGHYLARVALDYQKENGALEFAVQIPEGSSVSLGYATDRYLLEESYYNAKRMFGFHPQAIMIYACMSRRMLMGDDLAELEFDLYENIYPDATWAHGYGEILHANGLRGFLNASLVAVGIREGEISEEDKTKEYKDIDFPKEYFVGFKPLSERLVKFLETTTLDLRYAIDQLFKVASLDELTQIYNRRAINHFLQQQIDRYGAEGEVMVLLVDIDHFKHVNDTYGHDVGDMILKNGVDRVKSIVTQKDIIGRWGGEEFIMISPYSSKDKAIQTAEMIRKGVDDIVFEVAGHITISGGVTLLRPEDTIDTVFKRIDNALYEAKETGRNKMVFR